MNNFSLKSVAAAAALIAFSGTAMAQTSVTAATDLNVRAGPGPHYPVVGVIGANEEATLDGCLENSKWCAVAHNGIQGWSYSDYLTARFSSNQRVIVTERPSASIPMITHERTASSGGGAVAGLATGAVAGAIVGGPIGAAVGGVAGAATGGFVEGIAAPPAEVRTYVRSNETEPVYLEGEVVVGAGLPENVEVREIPNYEYRYVNVNGQPVLVEPGSRRIVYIIRE